MTSVEHNDLTLVERMIAASAGALVTSLVVTPLGQFPELIVVCMDIIHLLTVSHFRTE